MTQDAARQRLIDALAFLPPGSYTMDQQPGGVTVLWLLPEATEELARKLSPAGHSDRSEIGDTP